VPGEEHKVFVAPVFDRESFDPGRVNLRGDQGKYTVQFLLSRPGFPMTGEREHKFIDEIVGTSHVRIVKPVKERSSEEPDRILILPQGEAFRFEGIANELGFLGKVVVNELEAANAQVAENKAYGALAPFLSAWSVNLDVPINIETIEVTDLTTKVSSLRVRNPHLEMNFGGGPIPFFAEEFCQYASVYREGLNSNSPFYRFLCFFKIIESIIGRRARETAKRLAARESVQREQERIPQTKEDLLALLKRLYVWRGSWDDMSIEQSFPLEVRGKKLTWIHDHCLRPLRLGIAHALLKPGEITILLDNIEHIQQANKWLPICRIMARMMLLKEFPKECSLSMR
jgi:hypothetical protein